MTHIVVTSQHGIDLSLECHLPVLSNSTPPSISQIVRWKKAVMLRRDEANLTLEGEDCTMQAQLQRRPNS